MIPDLNTVFIARQPDASYSLPVREAAPELTGGEAIGAAAILLRRLMISAGLDAGTYGTAEWNPLSEFIKRGDRVVLKPNWVFHENASGEGMECLITHTSVLEAILEYTLKCEPRKIVIGDAPLQGCLLESLWKTAGVTAMVRRFVDRGARIEVRDFRTVLRTSSRIADNPVATGRPREAYVEYDLGRSSWLEPITSGKREFRVLMYDPRELEKTHSPGMHRYQVAREIVDADVVIGVPKLKTHKRACLTAALKNFVGVNGRKDFLPHHRAGGSARGGDNYEGHDFLCGIAENCGDYANQSQRPWLRGMLDMVAEGSLRLNRMRGSIDDVGGSWYGNDTIWRTILDLNRIVRFGRADGSMASSPQRRVVHITDAIVAGEGEGPLRPLPVPLGAMSLSCDAAAADWVHALLIGFDPRKIPLLRHAVEDAAHRPIRACMDGKVLDLADIPAQGWPRFKPPSGWKNHCELEEAFAC